MSEFLLIKSSEEQLLSEDSGSPVDTAYVTEHDGLPVLRSTFDVHHFHPDEVSRLNISHVTSCFYLEKTGWFKNTPKPSRTDPISIIIKPTALQKWHNCRDGEKFELIWQLQEFKWHLIKVNGVNRWRQIHGVREFKSTQSCSHRSFRIHSITVILVDS